MSRDPQELVRIFAGPLVDVEMRHEALTEAGIISKVVGGNLTASLGTALTDSVELWIHLGDAVRADAIIHGGATPREGRQFPHPTDSAKPAPPHTHKEPHVNPDPRS